MPQRNVVDALDAESGEGSDEERASHALTEGSARKREQLSVARKVKKALHAAQRVKDKPTEDTQKSSFSTYDGVCIALSADEVHRFVFEKKLSRSCADHDASFNLHSAAATRVQYTTMFRYRHHRDLAFTEAVSSQPRVLSVKIKWDETEQTVAVLPPELAKLGRESRGTQLKKSSPESA